MSKLFLNDKADEKVSFERKLFYRGLMVFAPIWIFEYMNEKCKLRKTFMNLF